jgi:hypothetical protein
LAGCEVRGATRSWAAHQTLPHHWHQPGFAPGLITGDHRIDHR